MSSKRFKTITSVSRTTSLMKLRAGVEHDGGRRWKQGEDCGGGRPEVAGQNAELG